MITSTLSLSIFPKDKRKICDFDRVKMNKKELRNYIDEKYAFKAMVKQNEYETTKKRNKDKDFRDNYLKSFIHKSEFTSVTLNKFKNHTMRINSNMP